MYISKNESFLIEIFKCVSLLLEWATNKNEIDLFPLKSNIQKKSTQFKALESQRHLIPLGADDIFFFLLAI